MLATFSRRSKEHDSIIELNFRDSAGLKSIIDKNINIEKG